ncbi:hypothetical protein [Bilophila wadsworthia]|jgi:hypothetical protein|uniref:hypothetical protein n=1 Tax=Bilophila wadsworthia TaxID=35833 RepID=UPI002593B293|nr:hypothetical protein [Bilophila wadsworthia]
MSDNHAIYEKEYLPFIIKWGRITNGAGLLLCFFPALVLARLRTHASGFGHSQRLFGHHECRWSGLICGAHFLFPDRRRRRDIYGFCFRQYQ